MSSKHESAAQLPGRTGIRDVAKHANVAMSSVSRVLSNHPDVSVRMRRKVLAAVEELGYTPDLLAQSLRRGATDIVGFVVGDISNPLLSQIALGAEITLRRSGYSMLVANSQNDPSLDAGHIRLFQQRRVDGLLLSLADEMHDGTLAALRTLRDPFVLIDRDLPDAMPASAVLSDHRGGIRMAAEHLIKLGHRRIALIGGSPNLRPSREREEAMLAACAERADVVPILKPGSFSSEHGVTATDEVLSMPDPPTAIIAGGNQILIGVLRALRARRLQVPDDISLVTCDEVPLSELLQPPIATVIRDPFTMGQIGASLLLARLKGEAPDRVVQPAQFAPTGSCAAPSPPRRPSTARHRTR